MIHLPFSYSSTFSHPRAVKTTTTTFTSTTIITTIIAITTATTTLTTLTIVIVAVVFYYKVLRASAAEGAAIVDPAPIPHQQSFFSRSRAVNPNIVIVDLALPSTPRVVVVGVALVIIGAVLVFVSPSLWRLVSIGLRGLQEQPSVTEQRPSSTPVKGPSPTLLCSLTTTILSIALSGQVGTTSRSGSGPKGRRAPPLRTSRTTSTTNRRREPVVLVVRAAWPLRTPGL